jgi:hypothetical protein
MITSMIIIEILIVYTAMFYVTGSEPAFSNIHLEHGVWEAGESPGHFWECHFMR